MVDHKKPTITVLCSTLGRTGLRGFLESWETQELIEGDRLWLYGDGWEGAEWLEEFPRVEFKPREHAGYYGHKHLVEGMNSVETTHYTFMGDDDRYMPWAFRDVREILTDVPVLTSIRVPEGKIVPYLRGKVFGLPCIGGWQMWIPSGIKLMNFTNASDAEAWRNYKANDGKYVERFDICPVFFKGARVE